MSYLTDHLSIVIGIIGVIFAFSFAIFVHELGHFMFAKLFGVKVEAFSIGFGKKLFGFTRGDTEYKICALPFGGYVKMVGTVSKELEAIMEGDKPATQEEREDAATAAAELSAPAPVTMAEGIQDEVNALRNKPYWQKLLVFAAGCINNVITAIVIFFLISWIGYNETPHRPYVVAGVEEIEAANSPIQVGDQIVSVGGKALERPGDFGAWFTDQEKVEDFQSSLTVEIVRNGTTSTLNLPMSAPGYPALPAGDVVAVGGEETASDHAVFDAAYKLIAKQTTQPVEIKLQAKRGEGQTTTVKAMPIAAVGPWWPLAVYEATGPARIEMLVPNNPAEKSGLKAGDVITAINDTPVSSSYSATAMLREMPGKDAKLTIDRIDKDGTTSTHVIALPIREHPDVPGRGQIGVVFGDARTEHTSFTAGESLTRAFTKSWAMVTGYVRAIKQIFGSSFTTIRENLSGPVGISIQFYKIAQSGWFEFFVTFAMFNIILALTNLLPLPVLDGGHILFATIEAIIRRPLPAKVMIAIYNVFTFLIIALALMITFNDLIMNAWRVIGK